MARFNLTPASITDSLGRIHYAWVMVAIAAVMWMVSSSIRFSTAVLVPDLNDPDGPLGWSYGAIAFAFSVQWLISGLMGPVMGSLSDRHGARSLLLVGSILFIAGMLLTGTMSHLWQFYLFFGILLGVSMSIFQVPLVSGVTVWFRTRLGLAMGSLQGIQALGTFALIPLIALLFHHFGLKWTFWVPGIAGGALLLLLIRPFHNEPAEVGLRPFGAPNDEPIQRTKRDETANIRNRVFVSQAKRTSAFWNLIGIHFWGCMGHNIFMVFLVAMAVDQGVSHSTAIGIYMALTVTSMIARFSAPILADILGSKGVMAVCFAMQVLPPIILLVTQDVWAFYLFAALFGIGVGGEVPAFIIINRQYYGNAPIGTVYGWEMLGNGIGMALGPLAGGFLWDQTGSFAAVVWLSIALSLAGFVSVLLLPTTSRLLIPNWEEALPPEVRSTGYQARGSPGYSPSLEPSGGEGAGS